MRRNREAKAKQRVINFYRFDKKCQKALDTIVAERGMKYHTIYKYFKHVNYLLPFVIYIIYMYHESEMNDIKSFIEETKDRYEYYSYGNYGMVNQNIPMDSWVNPYFDLDSMPAYNPGELQPYIVWL